MHASNRHVLMSLGVLALGIGILLSTGLINSPAYVKIGPRVFPYGIGALLVLCGALLVWRSLRGGWECDAVDAQAPPVDWSAIAWLGAGLIVNVALVADIGFVIASPIMFALVARAFGERRWLQSLGWGAVLSLISYIGFARILQIRIGTGIVDGWLDQLLDKVM